MGWSIEPEAIRSKPRRQPLDRFRPLLNREDFHAENTRR